MKTKKPIQAKNTQRILRKVFPPNFKFVNDKDSQGYKFVNLLYGVEVDEARSRIDDTYQNSFLQTMDFAYPTHIYEVNLSGEPLETLRSDTGQPIKITTEYEFYHGDPTRVILASGVPMTMTSPPVGLEYMRISPRGSGYLIINGDVDQSDALTSSEYPTYQIAIDTTGALGRYSGLYPGIVSRDFATLGTDELLVPEKSGVLLSSYPLTREVVDESGVHHTIDHYTPYHGWTWNENGEAVAVVDYINDYYFDSNGERVYYRTALNNPYGSGNYTTVYMQLEHIPISGTLKLYDIDILDRDGNATEIPSDGIDVYFYQHPQMLAGLEDGVFEPAYMGYESTVPYGMGFLKSEGSAATLIDRTSWDYLYEGSAINKEKNTFEEVSSGNMTNLIKISHPQSRYIVEYKYKLFDKAKYITSLDSTKYIRTWTQTPIYSIDNVTDNVIEVKYDYTRNPSQQRKYITFDGMEIRPNSRIYRIDFDIPMAHTEISPLTDASINISNRFMGYSNDYIPDINRKTVAANYLFNNSMRNTTVFDTTANNNDLTYYGTGTRRPIVYGSNFGERIEYTSGDSYYMINSGIFYNNDMFCKLNFTLQAVSDMTLLEFWDYRQSRYIKLETFNNGLLKIESNNVSYNSRDKISAGVPVELILHHMYDVEDEMLYYSLYMKHNNYYFKKLDLLRSDHDTANDSMAAYSYLHLFKNGAIDVDQAQIYYELTYTDADE